MATGSGPGGTHTPLDGMGKKGKQIQPARKQIKDIKLDKALAQLNVTPKLLANGTYQKKLVAFFAQFLGPDLMNSVRRGLLADDPSARRLASEILDIVKKDKAGINIALNQTNQTANVRAAMGEAREYRSFEDIARSISDKRQRRIMAPAAPVFEATPED